MPRHAEKKHKSIKSERKARIVNGQSKLSRPILTVRKSRRDN